MSAIVISSDSPIFTCQSPACYIDAESIDTSYVYDSEYQSSCTTNPTITVIGGGEDGIDGSDGSDGRGITSIIRTSGDGSAGSTDTYTITYTDATTSTFNVYNGVNGEKGDTGDTGDNGAPGTAGSDGTDGIDGATITATSSVPTGGNNGDLHIRTTTYDLYRKDAGVWGIIGNVQGATGASGADGSDGTDGDKWSYGSVIPTSTTVNTFDEYYIYTINNDIYYKAEGASTWSVITNINGNVYKTSSTTSVNLTTLTVGDSVSLTVDSSLAYTIGQFVVVSNSTSNQFTGKVSSYSGTTLQLTVTYTTGTGTLASWDVNLAGVVESGSTPQWYEITATAGTGAATTRAFTGPAGWTIDTSDVIAHTNLGTNTTDITIVHNTGLSVAEVTILSTNGTLNTELIGTKAYGTVRETSILDAIEIMSLATVAEALIIRINLQ